MAGSVAQYKRRALVSYHYDPLLAISLITIVTMAEPIMIAWVIPRVDIKEDEEKVTD